MANDLWPIIWPTAFEETVSAADPDVVARAEQYAADTLRMLTLYRVGGKPITVMPCDSSVCGYPRFPDYDLYSAADLQSVRLCSCSPHPYVELVGPVGRIDAITIDGTLLSPAVYRVEDGNKLVRTDGYGWPSCAGDDFTVTYLNAYPVDTAGKYVGGILAAEYLKSITNDKKCRLPSGVTSITRNGVSMEMTTAMFPEGTTGITEVDSYLMRWNPHGLRTRPTVHSPDLRKQRQITWSAP